MTNIKKISSSLSKIDINYSSNLPRAIKILHSNIFPKYGKGSWLFDNNNTKYLDFTSGIGALSTGHSHPHIIEAVKTQVDKYVHSPQQIFNIHEASNKLTPSLLKITIVGNPLTPNCCAIDWLYILVSFVWDLLLGKSITTSTRFSSAYFLKSF